MEDCHFQHQRHQRAPASAPEVAGEGIPRRRVPSGAQGARHRLSPTRDSQRGIRCHLARSALLERRRDPAEGRRIPSRRDGAYRAIPDDSHSRYIEAAIDGIVVGCLYLPNGNPQPGPKFDYKLAWFERLNEHARTLAEAASAGDPGGRLQRRADGFRHLQPEVMAQGRAAAARRAERRTSDCWSRAGPMRSALIIRRSASIRSGITSVNHWARNAGLRIDHLLLSDELAPRLVDANVDRWVRGEPKPSDHAPTWVQLSDAARRR